MQPCILTALEQQECTTLCGGLGCQSRDESVSLCKSFLNCVALSERLTFWGQLCLLLSSSARHGLLLPLGCLWARDSSCCLLSCCWAKQRPFRRRWKLFQKSRWIVQMRPLTRGTNSFNHRFNVCSSFPLFTWRCWDCGWCLPQTESRLPPHSFATLNVLRSLFPSYFSASAACYTPAGFIKSIWDRLSNSVVLLQIILFIIGFIAHAWEMNDNCAIGKSTESVVYLVCLFLEIDYLRYKLI